MAQSIRWTSADLELLPDDGKRYEIVDGELFVSKQPHLNHQIVCHRVAVMLDIWNSAGLPGRVIPAPGLIFDEDDDAVPDLVWISREEFENALQIAREEGIHRLDSETSYSV